MFIEPNPSVSYYDEVIRYCVTVETQQLTKHMDLVGWPFVDQAKKNDAVMRASFAKHFLSKASIISDQNASFELRNLNDPIIVNSACLMINREYVVALLLQPIRHRRAGALINQKLHLRVLHLERNE